MEISFSIRGVEKIEAVGDGNVALAVGGVICSFDYPRPFSPHLFL